MFVCNTNIFVNYKWPVERKYKLVQALKLKFLDQAFLGITTSMYSVMKLFEDLIVATTHYLQCHHNINGAELLPDRFQYCGQI